MKKWMVWAFGVLMTGVFLPARSQTVAATPGASAAKHPSLRDRIKDLTQKIREEEASGKIDGKRAKDLRAKVSQSRFEITADVKANSKKPLTSEQTRKIEGELDAISSQL